MNKKPDYSIGALDKTRDVRQPKIGAAWKNADGSISLRIDPFVVLQGGPQLLVTLFPEDAARVQYNARRKPSSPDEEIPF